MDASALWAAILLGIIEGITEFLPISSTGHMILAIDVFKLHTPPGKIFEVAIQLGAILAVCWHYRATLGSHLLGVRSSPKARRFFGHILLAFIPVALVGILTHGLIKEHLFNAHVVAIALILGGVAILIIERCKPDASIASVESFTMKTALLIGLFQITALIPGISRSGATIMGALLIGVDRKSAAEFSFYLAIPTLGAASLFDLINHWGGFSADDLIMIAVGGLFAFISALLVIRLFIDFVARCGFSVFAWYRIALGAVMLALISGA